MANVLIKQSAIVWLLIGMAVVNYTLRFVPLALLSRVKLPHGVMRWLSYVPVAVMGALLATETLIPAVEAAIGTGKGTGVPVLLTPLWENAGIYGALAAMLAYRISKSFIGSTVAGIIVYALVKWLVGG